MRSAMSSTWGRCACARCPSTRGGGMRTKRVGANLGDEHDEQVEAERDEHVPDGVKLGIRDPDARKNSAHEAAKRDVHEPELDRSHVSPHAEAKEPTHARALARLVQEIHTVQREHFDEPEADLKKPELESPASEGADERHQGAVRHE